MVDEKTSSLEIGAMWLLVVAIVVIMGMIAVVDVVVVVVVAANDGCDSRNALLIAVAIVVVGAEGNIHGGVSRTKLMQAPNITMLQCNREAIAGASIGSTTHTRILWLATVGGTVGGATVG